MIATLQFNLSNDNERIQHEFALNATHIMTYVDGLIRALYEYKADQDKLNNVIDDYYMLFSQYLDQYECLDWPEDEKEVAE